MALMPHNSVLTHGLAQAKIFLQLQTDFALLFDFFWLLLHPSICNTLFYATFIFPLNISAYQTCITEAVLLALLTRQFHNGFMSMNMKWYFITQGQSEQSLDLSFPFGAMTAGAKISFS